MCRTSDKKPMSSNAVSFVEYKAFNRCKRKVPLPDVIEQTIWRDNDNIDTAPQSTGLIVHSHAAENCGDAHAPYVCQFVRLGR